jgi:hypothetical protein
MADDRAHGCGPARLTVHGAWRGSGKMVISVLLPDHSPPIVVLRRAPS